MEKEVAKKHSLSYQELAQMLVPMLELDRKRRKAGFRTEMRRGKMTLELEIPETLHKHFLKISEECNAAPSELFSAMVRQITGIRAAQLFYVEDVADLMDYETRSDTRIDTEEADYNQPVEHEDRSDILVDFNPSNL